MGAVAAGLVGGPRLLHGGQQVPEVRGGPVEAPLAVCFLRYRRPEPPRLVHAAKAENHQHKEQSGKEQAPEQRVAGEKEVGLPEADQID